MIQICYAWLQFALLAVLIEDGRSWECWQNYGGCKSDFLCLHTGLAIDLIDSLAAISNEIDIKPNGTLGKVYYSCYMP